MFVERGMEKAMFLTASVCNCLQLQSVRANADPTRLQLETVMATGFHHIYYPFKEVT